jgi:hypothetical protein
MAASIVDSLTRIGGNALIGLADRVERWANEEYDPPAPVSESIDMSSFAADDPSFAFEDRGWIQYALGEQMYGYSDLRPVDRITNVRRARIYYVKDAYSKQAIRLHTVYTVGRGMSIKARDYKTDTPDQPEDPADIGADTADEMDAATTEIQREADTFWEHPANDCVFAPINQAMLADRLNTDGELFYNFIVPDMGDPQSDGVTYVRVITDCLQITRIITNPDDDAEVWYYLRVTWENGKVRKRLYPDYHLVFSRGYDPETGDIDLPNISATTAIGGDRYTVYGGDLDGAKIVRGQFIYHQKVNTIGQRGNSLLTPAMDWSKVNRQYLEDRATISKAHAKFAWKRLIKGPANAVAAFGKKTISGQNQQAVSGVPLPTAVGQTLNVNTAMDMEPINAQDGGKNAYVESRNFRLMFYAAVGFGEHYFGDGSMGTRATSTQMERPTELMLQAFQYILKSGYEVMFAFHLTVTGHEYDAHAVWVDAPSILEADMMTVVTAILSVIGVLPQFDIDEVILKMLQAFGIDDPQDVLVKIRARQRELYEQNLQLAAIQAGLSAAQDAVGQTDPVSDPTGHIAALQNVNKAQAKYLSMVTAPGDPTKQPGPKVGPQFAQPGTKGGALLMRKPSPPKLRPNSQAAPQ